MFFKDKGKCYAAAALLVLLSGGASFLGTGLYFTNNGGGSSLSHNDMVEVTKNVIRDNPELIIQSVENMQMRKYQQMQEEAKTYAQGVGYSEGDFVFGNPDGKTQVIVFMDYLCGHCKQGDSMIKDAISQHKDLKVIVKPTAIFGQISHMLATNMLVIYKDYSHLFGKIHYQLMSEETNITNEDQFIAILKSYNIDTNKVQEKAKSDEISKYLQGITQEMTGLNLNGTPAFIVGGELIPGLPRGNRLKEMIAKAIDEKHEMTN